MERRHFIQQAAIGAAAATFASASMLAASDPTPSTKKDDTAMATDTAESKRILTSRNSALILLDHEPQMLFGIQSHDRATLVNNVAGLAETGKAFNLPVVLTTVAEDFSGPLIPEISRVFPGIKPIDRTTLNAWAEPNFVAAVKATGRKKLIMAGWWTELCLTLPTLSALDAGYEVYIVSDASGSGTKEAHDLGIQRMAQAGAVPMTWVGVISELQYDWARKETYEAVNKIFVERGGAFGSGVNYYQAMQAAAQKKQVAN